MNRTKALAVLHRISDNCKMVTVDIISLDSEHSKNNNLSDDYQIRLKCSCEIHSCEALENILEEYHLEMKEEKGFLVLHTKI